MTMDLSVADGWWLPYGLGRTIFVLFVLKYLPAPTNNSSYIGRVISFYFVFVFVLESKSHGPRQHRGPCDWILTNFLNALVMRRTILHDQFWLFAGQCKSVAGQWKLLYIFGSKVAICVGEEFD